MPALEIAAALAKLSIGDRPLLMKPDKPRPARTSDSRRTGPDSREDRREPRRGRTQSRPPDKDKERFRIEVNRPDEGLLRTAPVVTTGPADTERIGAPQ